MSAGAGYFAAIFGLSLDLPLGLVIGVVILVIAAAAAGSIIGVRYSSKLLALRKDLPKNI